MHSFLQKLYLVNLSNMPFFFFPSLPLNTLPLLGNFTIWIVKRGFRWVEMQAPSFEVRGRVCMGAEFWQKWAGNDEDNAGRGVGPGRTRAGTAGWSLQSANVKWQLSVWCVKDLLKFQWKILMREGKNSLGFQSLACVFLYVLKCRVKSLFFFLKWILWITWRIDIYIAGSKM